MTSEAIHEVSVSQVMAQVASILPQPRRAALAAWLALTAPGLLLTRSLILAALIALPWLAPTHIIIAPAVRAIAAALLLVHTGCTLRVARQPGQWPPALAWFAALALDASLCGFLLGLDLRWHSPASALTVVVLATVFAGGGWRALLLSTVPLALGATIGTATTLPSLIQVSGAASPLDSIAMRLSVETVYAGAALASRTASPWAATFALCFVALCLGLGVSLVRVRRARDTVAVQLIAAARLMT